MPGTLQTEIEISRMNQKFVLRGDGTVFLPEFKALLVADLHLGKSASFRAVGLAVPDGPDIATLDLLSASIEEAKPQSVCLLGDLIHNRDSMTTDLVEAFANWRKQHKDIEMHLVRGNHDRHVRSFPDSWQLSESHCRVLGAFELVHDLPATFGLSQASQVADVFKFGGHWHPVIHVGRAADMMRLPCFVVSQRHVTLPAFGPFKGGMKQLRMPSFSFYGIADGIIWQVGGDGSL